MWLSGRMCGSGSVWEGGSVAAEGEHGEGDECLGGSEPEGDAGEESDLGVGRLDQSLGEPVFERGVDGGAVFDDAALQLDEGGDAASSSPADPAVEGFLSGVAFEHENGPEAFFEQVGAVQPGVGLGDPVQLVSLVVGEVLGVLPQRVAGTADGAGSFMTGAGRGVGCWSSRSTRWFAAGLGAGVVPGRSADLVECLGGGRVRWSV